MILTQNPSWMEKFLESVGPYQDRIVNSPLFVGVECGDFPLGSVRAALFHFYPLIEAFPKFMSRTLARVPADHCRRHVVVRDWLNSNIRAEQKHAAWYRQWAQDFGIPSQLFRKQIQPLPCIDAINRYLWHISEEGTLAEAVAAVNYGVEGPTGVWTRKISRSIENYCKIHDLKVRKATLRWLRVHANYDELHPIEALEIIKMFATTRESQERVRRAALHSLECYAIAAETVHNISLDFDCGIRTLGDWDGAE